MKDKIILISFGLLMGLIILGITYPLLKYFGIEIFTPAGSKFETVDDLRAELSKPKNTNKDKITLKDLFIPHSSNLIMFELAPNLDVRFQRANVKTNSHGMRDKERSVEKPDNTYRIAFLGDSFVFGWGVEKEEMFSNILEDNLNSKNPSLKYEVLNFGVPGYSTFQQAEQLIKKVNKFKPDAILVYVVENDFGLPFFITNFEEGTNELLPAKDFHSMGKIKDSSAKDEKKIIIDAIDPNRAFKKMKDYCKENNIKLLVTINPNKKIKSVKDRLWFLKSSRYTKYIPLRKRFLKTYREMNIPEKDLSLSFDPHPSPVKHKIIGDILAEAIWNHL